MKEAISNIINVKKRRIKITNMNDFIEIARIEGCYTDEVSIEKTFNSILEKFNVNNLVVEYLYKSLNEGEVTYKVKDIKGLVDYIETIIRFDELHILLSNKISKVSKIIIDRVEYEREVTIPENVEHMLKVIDAVKNKTSLPITEEELEVIEMLEKDIADKNIFTKDIELLKKIILTTAKNVVEDYDCERKVKRVTITVSSHFTKEYIKPNIGTVEYYYHIKSSIQRTERILKHIDKIWIRYEQEANSFYINQSSILQDTINLAFATFGGYEFKAISGSSDIIDYCKCTPKEKAVFKSSKVNKLGKLGIGYNRINDSEKKILEEINRQIIGGQLENSGEIVLYTKWEPCPSCYYVISEFCKRYPRINFKIKYKYKYGEG